MGKLIVELPDELHLQLKQQAATDRKTIKVIVVSLLDHYLRHPVIRSSKRATGLCGAWKDRRSADELLRELRAGRRLWMRPRA